MIFASCLDFRCPIYVLVLCYKLFARIMSLLAFLFIHTLDIQHFGVLALVHGKLCLRSHLTLVIPPLSDEIFPIGNRG